MCRAARVPLCLRPAGSEWDLCVASPSLRRLFFRFSSRVIVRVLAEHFKCPLENLLSRHALLCSHFVNFLIYFFREVYGRRPLCHSLSPDCGLTSMTVPCGHNEVQAPRAPERTAHSFRTDAGYGYGDCRCDDRHGITV